MSGFRSVGSYKGTFLIRSKDGSLFTLLVLNSTVEEDYRNVGSFCLVDDLSRSIVGTRSNDIYDQKVSAGLDGGIDLLVLCGLVVVCVIILIGNTHLVQLRVKSSTNGSNVGVRVSVIEDADVQVGFCSAVSAFAAVRSAAAADSHCCYHCYAKEHCHDSLFHKNIPSFLVLKMFKESISCSLFN